MSIFSELTLLPVDPILSLPITFAADPRANKVNLGVGVYQDEAGLTMVLECVRAAEERITAQKLGKSYLPIEGNAAFLSAATSLIFGEGNPILAKERLFAIQTIGGTGALRLAAEFIRQRVGSKTIYLPEPSWPNHRQICFFAGLDVVTYPYCNSIGDVALTCDAWLAAISDMPRGSAILLHACCHNPSGIDPTEEQWHKLLAALKQQGILPLFDLAYQGLGSDIHADAFAVRYAGELGMEFLVASSYSKNFGLYGERAGMLTAAATAPCATPRIASHLKQLSRALISNPPLHPARIVATILTDDELRALWIHELTAMRQRISTMRNALVDGLQGAAAKSVPASLRRQQGMFSFCGLAPHQVQQLRDTWAIHTPSDGRINIAGINKGNLEYVVKALTDVLSNSSPSSDPINGV